MFKLYLYNDECLDWMYNARIPVLKI